VAGGFSFRLRFRLRFCLCFSRRFCAHYKLTKAQVVEYQYFS
jgi:hypothetical protein